MKTFKPEVKPGRPITCPRLRKIVDSARAIPRKMLSGEGSGATRIVEADHWMDKCIGLAEQVTDVKNFETLGTQKHGKYEASRAVAMESIWDVYGFLQSVVDNDVSESRSEFRQREYLDIELESWEQYCASHSE